MNVLVLADTHIPYACEVLPKQIYEAIKKNGVKLILHAGDLCDKKVLESLAELAEVKAVHGNMDDPELKHNLPEKLIVEIGGFKIGLTHGEGSPVGIVKKVTKKFSGKNLDMIIFGHTHRPYNEWINGTLYFNPGSVTDKVFAPYNSYGILTIDKTIKAEVVRIEK